MITTLNEKSFDQEVLQAKGSVLVDFYADWCMPCKMLAPVMEEIAGERPDVKVCKVNIDESPALAQAYGVMSIPTLMVVKDGKVTQRTMGVQPKADILRMVEA